MTKVVCDYCGGYEPKLKVQYRGMPPEFVHGFVMTSIEEDVEDISVCQRCTKIVFDYILNDPRKVKHHGEDRM